MVGSLTRDRVPYRHRVQGAGYRQHGGPGHVRVNLAAD